MEKKSKLLITFGFLFVLGTVNVFASPLDNKNDIGLYVLGGDFGVYGIQYERRFSDLFSLKFDFYGSFGPNNYDSIINSNIEADFRLFQAAWGNHFGSRLFAYALAGYEYMEESIYDVGLIKKDYNHILILSAGFGFDFLLIDHLSIPIQLGFMFRPINSLKVEMCGGAAIRYSW